MLHEEVTYKETSLHAHLFACAVERNICPFSVRAASTGNLDNLICERLGSCKFLARFLWLRTGRHDISPGGKAIPESVLNPTDVDVSDKYSRSSRHLGHCGGQQSHSASTKYHGSVTLLYRCPSRRMNCHGQRLQQGSRLQGHMIRDPG